MKENIVLFIVDDDEDDKKLFMASAKEINERITFVTASDGQEALKLLKDEHNKVPDYIFLDLGCPASAGQNV